MENSIGSLTVMLKNARQSEPFYQAIARQIEFSLYQTEFNLR